MGENEIPFRNVGVTAAQEEQLSYNLMELDQVLFSLFSLCFLFFIPFFLT